VTRTLRAKTLPDSFELQLQANQLNILEKAAQDCKLYFRKYILALASTYAALHLEPCMRLPES
jgi:hypothetical protein